MAAAPIDPCGQRETLTADDGEVLEKLATAKKEVSHGVRLMSG